MGSTQPSCLPLPAPGDSPSKSCRGAGAPGNRAVGWEHTTLWAFLSQHLLQASSCLAASPASRKAVERSMEDTAASGKVQILATQGTKGPCKGNVPGETQPAIRGPQHQCGHLGVRALLSSLSEGKKKQQTNSKRTKTKELVLQTQPSSRA